jgi:hypothetical protein
VTNDTESGTSKNRQARKNNISIINENEFTDIINAPEKAIDYNKMKKTTAKTASFETEGLDIAELALVDEQKETKIHFKPPVSVEIVYRDSMGEVTERKIDIFTRKSNRSDMEKDYLYAFCHLDNKVLTFRIDRIQQATANGKKVDIVQYLADAYRNDDKDSTIGRQISKE